MESSFSSLFLLFPIKTAGGHAHSSRGKSLVSHTQWQPCLGCCIQMRKFLSRIGKCKLNLLNSLQVRSSLVSGRFPLFYRKFFFLGYMKRCLSTSSISSHWQLQFKNFFCIFSLDLATKSGKTLPVNIEYYLPVNIGFWWWAKR